MPPNTVSDLMKKLAEQNIEVQTLRHKNTDLKEQVEDLTNDNGSLKEEIAELNNMEDGGNLHEKQKREACNWLVENCSVEDLCQLANLTANVQEKPYPYPGYLGEGIYLPPIKSGE